MASFVNIDGVRVNPDLIACFSSYDGEGLNERTYIQYPGTDDNIIIVNRSVEEVQQLLFAAGHVFNGVANSYHEGQKDNE